MAWTPARAHHEILMVAEAKRIFEDVGLVGPHWQLPGADERF